MEGKERGTLMKGKGQNIMSRNLNEEMGGKGKDAEVKEKDGKLKN